MYRSANLFMQRANWSPDKGASVKFRNRKRKRKTQLPSEQDTFRKAGRVRGPDPDSPFAVLAPLRQTLLHANTLERIRNDR